MAEHLATADEVRDYGRRWSERLAMLPGRVTQAQRRPVQVHAVREQLLPLVES